jgi:coenzyme PQQ precursor peptide PqqA
VTTVELQTWETPQFEEIGVAPEVTMYVAQMDD